MVEASLAIEIRARDAASRTLRRVGGSFARFRTSAMRSLRAVTRQVFNLRNALLGLGLFAFGRAIIKTAGAWEVLHVQLETVLGSAEKARKVFEETRKQAAKTPFQISELVEVRALFESVGIAGKEAVRAVGDAAGAMGRNIRDVAAAVISLETEPLRRLGIQLSRVGDTATFVFRDRMGKEITKVAKGSFVDLQTALLDIFDVKFKGGMERFSKAWRGMWSNVLDAAAEAANAIGEAGLLDVLKDFASKKLKPVIERTTEWVKANKDLIEQKVWESYEKIADAVGRIAENSKKAIPIIQGFGKTTKAAFVIPEIPAGAAIGAKIGTLIGLATAGVPGGAIGTGVGTVFGGLLGAIISTLRSLPKAIRETTFETRKERLNLELEIKNITTLFNATVKKGLGGLIPPTRSQDLFGLLTEGAGEGAAPLSAKVREIITKTEAEILKLQGRGFDAQAMLQEAAFDKMLEKVGKFQEARERLEVLHQLRIQDIVEKREAALAAFVTKELGIGLERDFLRRQQERKIARQIKLLEEALDRGIISLDKFREAERKLRESLRTFGQSLPDVTSKIKDQADKARFLLGPALDDAGRAARIFADNQKAMKDSVDDSTSALNRQMEAVRRTVSLFRESDVAAFSGGRPVLFRTPALSGAELSARFSAQFAQHGAVLNRATLLVGGEAGRELVVPADRSQRSPEVQREFERLAAAEGGGETTIVVPVHLDGREITRVVARHTKRGVR